MSQFWEHHLVELREQVQLMAGLAERNVAMALRALDERNDQLANVVETEDSQIDQLEVHIDEMVVHFMATHAPVAKDCRLMLAASKISANLERVGDSATTIARRARELNGPPPLEPPADFPRLRKLVCIALQDAIESFIHGDPERAAALVPRDKAIDTLCRQTFSQLTNWMLEDPAKITRCLALTAIVRTLERIGDHAANIAEEVVYLCRGEDIRHTQTDR